MPDGTFGFTEGPEIVSKAALFGGTPTHISGPTAPMTAVSMVDIASQIPAAVLAGIFITVGIGVMDYRGLRALSKILRSEVGVMFVVLVLAVVWNLVYAVGIGLVLASLSFMKKIGDRISYHYHDYY